MDKEFFMNSSILPQLQFDHPFSPTMQIWQSLDCFIPTQPPIDHFDSALSSMVSSPTCNSALSTDNFMMRELIGKLGNISNSNDIPNNYINGGNCSANNSCDNTPLSSPPKLGKSMPNIHHMVNENPSCLGNSIGLSSNLPAMPGDPGFAERAARFSSFGSRSCNGRTMTSTTNTFKLNNAKRNGEYVDRSCSNLGGGNGKLQRVLSSPSLKVEPRSQVDNNINNNSMNEQNAEFSQSVENSSIWGRNQAKQNGTGRKRKAACSKGKAEETGSYSQTPINSNKVVENGNESNAKRKRLEDCSLVEDGNTKEDENKGGDDGKKEEQKPVEVPKDYIHVRARRGQATDSHSLAERVRREKIGERMKLLQDLVPGCNKVTGKALMLEEIINYVQSLQKQVEFLSMKLSNVDARVEMNMNNQLSKDGIQANGCLPYPMYPPYLPTQYEQPQQNHLHDTTTFTGAMDPLTPALNHNNNNHAYHLPPFNGFFNCLSQLPSLCEGDLQSIVQMGFGQKEKGFEAQTLHGD